MAEVEDLEEQFKINPGKNEFSPMDIDFKLGELQQFEIKEKKKFKVEIYEPRSNDTSSRIF